MAENRLLIIEDDKAIAKALTMNLELAGYIVTHYDDGGQALDGLKQDHSFDLALLDMMLPGVDGFGLLPVLGSYGIPVICLTALTDTQSEIQGLREGAEDYVTKPFRMAALLVRIEKVLEYINEERVCRSRMLLSYFGEEDSAPCGCCDVCLSKHESQLMNWEFNAIRESLIKILAGESPIPVKELIEKLPFPQEKSLTAIRFLADQDPRFTLSDGYLSHEDSAK